MKTNTFGNKLKHYRLQRKLSLRKLAQQADLYFTNIDKIERGTYTCGTLTAEKLAMALQLKDQEREAFLKSAHTTTKRKMKEDIQWVGKLIEQTACNAIKQEFKSHSIFTKNPKNEYDHDLAITLLDGRKYGININIKRLS